MKTFEFNSQIGTTKEQSEKLLALGLKKENEKYINKYINTMSIYPLGIIPNDKKLPLRVRFALWLLGFKRSEEKR